MIKFGYTFGILSFDMKIFHNKGNLFSMEVSRVVKISLLLSILKYLEQTHFPPLLFLMLEFANDIKPEY